MMQRYSSQKFTDFAIGIDLGTTNSVAGVYGIYGSGNRKGKVEIIPVDGHPVLPSVVSFKSAEETVVGHVAKTRILIDPEHGVSSVKRHMGRRDYGVLFYGKQYTPAQISSLILGKIKKAAEDFLGCDVDEAVITVPAYFTSRQKQDTKEAGELAGLNVLRIIPEPTAAAIAYGVNKQRNQTLLVYDLGGGTFDVSVVEVNNNRFRVRAVGGNSQLGGDDFDWLIVQYLADQFRRSSGIDLLDNGATALPITVVRPAVQRLKETAEKAKKELSESEVASIDIPDLVEANSLSVELTRKQFEEMISHIVWSTRDTIVQVLNDAGLSPQEIDRVLLVGGSTRIPLIRKIVTELIREPYIADNVDLTVGEGAAVVAASIKLAERAGVDIAFENVTAHNLGTGFIVPGDDRPRCAVLVPRNTSLSEAHGSHVFTTSKDFQKEVLVDVYQGLDQDEFCGGQWLVDYFVLSGIQSAPQGVPQIEVTFEMDDNDILHVSARDLSTGASCNVSMSGVQTI